MAGKLYGIPVRGTHAHAFVTSFTGLEDLQNNTLTPSDGTEQPEMVRKTFMTHSLSRFQAESQIVHCVTPKHFVVDYFIDL